MLDSLVKINAEQRALLADIKTAMQRYFGDDQRRIEHALSVTMYAEQLLAYIDADPVLVLASAYLHDIGIPESERKHGSNSGKWQEIEGPPVARGLLHELGAGEVLTGRVAEIIANHHTRDGLNSPEFRVIWDADALVNFAEVLPNKNEFEREDILQRHMVTEAGYRMARRIFLADTESHSRCLKGHRPAILP